MTDIEGSVTKGKIGKLSDGIAWGALDNGMTFDFPCDASLFKIGDQVDFVQDNQNIFCVYNAHYMLMHFVDEDDDGYSISGSVFYPRILH